MCVLCAHAFATRELNRCPRRGMRFVVASSLFVLTFVVCPAEFPVCYEIMWFATFIVLDIHWGSPGLDIVSSFRVADVSNIVYARGGLLRCELFANIVQIKLFRSNCSDQVVQIKLLNRIVQIKLFRSNCTVQIAQLKLIG